MKHPNIYQRKDVGTYFFAKMVDGKRRRISLGTDDLREALRKADLLRDHPLAVVAPGKGSLAEAVEIFLKHKADFGRRHMERGYSPRSVSAKGYTLTKFVKWMPTDKTVASVTSEDVAAWHEHLRYKEGRSESTANGYLMTVRAFFRWAVEVERLRLENPVKKVKLPKVEHVARTEFVDLHEAERLIHDAPHDDLRFICFAGFDAGLRRSEIDNARRDWFDLKAGVLHVRAAEHPPRLRDSEKTWRPKFGKERTIPLTLMFKKFLIKYLNGREPLDYALKPEVRHGKGHFRYDFRRPFRDYMISKKYRWVTPHVMRHSFTSNLASAGLPFLELAKWLGDSVTVLERHYAHFAPSSRKIDMLHPGK